jgi:BASS family bile acid:Na+ symporter
MKLLEKYYWVWCVLATLLGLLLPAVNWPLRDAWIWVMGLQVPLLGGAVIISPVTIALMGILFFGGLKIDFAAAVGEFRRPAFLAYMLAMCMIVMPIGIWLITRWLMPEFALGMLVLAAMPAGVVCSSLTEIARGNSALALVGTLATTLVCPVIAPLVISLDTGELAAGGFLALANQSVFMAAILFVPLLAAWLVRRHWPAAVARRRQAFTGISVIFLIMVILTAMSRSSKETLNMVTGDPPKIAILMLYLCGFSAVLNIAGWCMALWRPPADRAALAINSAYVNNALGIAFASGFLVGKFGMQAMLPAVLLEIPMDLAILPVRWYLARKMTAGTARATV